MRTEGHPRRAVSLLRIPMLKINKQDALNYHSQEPAGKLEVVPTKPMSTQLDLALAYSPGVAEPCKAIAANPDDV